jgi:tetrahydromethanopterin S-methyltransferase subunit B
MEMISGSSLRTEKTCAEIRTFVGQELSALANSNEKQNDVKNELAAITKSQQASLIVAVKEFQYAREMQNTYHVSNDAMIDELRPSAAELKVFHGQDGTENVT